jgi:hypothetical protein
MNATRDELTHALVEVRKAYRILYAYHIRVLDACSQVVNSLQCNGRPLQYFYAWCYSLGDGNPPRFLKENPLSLDPWLFLPLKDYSLFFSNTGDDSFSRKGYWLLDVRVVSDSAYSDEWWTAPAGGFLSTEQSETYLMIYVFKRIRNEKGKWLNDVHGKVDWPDPGELLSFDEIGVDAYGTRLEFADLSDGHSTKKTLEKLTTKLKKQIKIGFNVRRAPAD